MGELFQAIFILALLALVIIFIRRGRKKSKYGAEIEAFLNGGGLKPDYIWVGQCAMEARQAADRTLRWRCNVGVYEDSHLFRIILLDDLSGEPGHREEVRFSSVVSVDYVTGRGMLVVKIDHFRYPEFWLVLPSDKLTAYFRQALKAH